MGATWRTVRASSLRVLLFHAVAEQRPRHLGWPERRYWVSATEFRSQLALLTRLGHPVLDLGSAWSCPNSDASGGLLGPPREPAPVVLTFDDGHRSDAALVWPLLREAGWTATFFVNTSTLDKPGYLRLSDLKRMSAEGAEFGSHGHRHVDLTALDGRALKTELRDSKSLLEGWITRPVNFLAVPHGRVNRRVVEEALMVGYWAVCTSTPWPALSGARTVNRVAIHAGTSSESFQGLVRGDRWPYWRRKARALCLALPHRLLPAPSVRPTKKDEVAI